MFWWEGKEGKREKDGGRRAYQEISIEASQRVVYSAAFKCELENVYLCDQVIHQGGHSIRELMIIYERVPQASLRLGENILLTGANESTMLCSASSLEDGAVLLNMAWVPLTKLARFCNALGTC